MRFAVAFAFTALLGVRTLPLSAQSSFIPGSESNGQIRVQVNVTLSDGAGDDYPVPNFALTLFRSATDSTQLATDEAGVLRFTAAPGTYRLASTAPIQWRGRSYRWNIPLVVRHGMGLVELTNANVSGTNVEVSSRNDASSDAIAFKDPTLATILSILIPGAGQMYAGKPLKGALVIVSILGSLGVAASVQDPEECSETSFNGGAAIRTCTGGNPPSFQIALGAAAASYLFGIATAGNDARDYNTSRRHRVSLRSTLDRSEGSLAVGLALSY